MKGLFKKNNYLKAFVIGLLTAFCIFLPYLVIDGGFFTYAGDYNSQQIPFYMYMVRMVQSGSLNWGWAIDLGSSVVTSYSFYLLGSPFFWLSCLFPYKAIPYILPYLLMLKFAVGTLGSFGYLKRYAKSDNYALVGALMYTFSGFSIYNIFFNHFIESVVFFPYLLWALDEYVYDKKKGLFPVAVAVNLVNNYFFFIGQVVFLFIYFAVKTYCKEYRVTVKEFINLAFESVLGCLMGIVLFIPSAISLMQNPRATRTLSGFGIWLYGNVQQYFEIFTSALLPPDPPYIPSLFTQGAIKWTSMSRFLAFGGLFGLFVFAKYEKRSAFFKTFAVCVICAFTPVLNSMFYAFNSSYYARWFYMPLLMLAAMNMQSFAMEKDKIFHGLKVTAALTAVLLLFGLTPIKKDDGSLFIGLASEVAIYWMNILVAFLSLYLVWVVVHNKKDSYDYTKHLINGTLLVIMLFSLLHMGVTKMPQFDADKLYKPQNYDILDKYNFPFDEEKNYRMDTFNCYDNLSLFTGVPCIQFFNSTVSPSIMKFYPSVGVKRDVSSKPEANLYALRSLLSVKYLVTPQWEVANYEGSAKMSNWTELKNEYPYTVFENSYFVPMGFAYDKYVTYEALDRIVASTRGNILMRAIALDPVIIEKYGLGLEELEDESLADASFAAFENDVENRKSMSSSYFEMDKDGFECKISLYTPNLVFFSVPYDEGFTAYVNGEEAEIIEVNYGLCAVYAPRGENEIVFTYRAKGLNIGIAVSCCAVAVYAVYILYNKKKRT